jgi:hypothetical protein
MPAYRLTDKRSRPILALRHGRASRRIRIGQALSGTRLPVPPQGPKPLAGLEPALLSEPPISFAFRRVGRKERQGTFSVCLCEPAPRRARLPDF